MNTVRWGMIGCGGVTELKSGPAFYKAPGSALAAVMGGVSMRCTSPLIGDRSENLDQVLQRNPIHPESSY